MDFCQCAIFATLFLQPSARIVRILFTNLAFSTFYTRGFSRLRVQFCWVAAERTKTNDRCGFSALEGHATRMYGLAVMTRGSFFMKKLTLAMAAVLALLSIVGCAQTGKGKAPPPVVTKG